MTGGEVRGLEVLGVVVGSVINALLLTVAARRLLGVPVGWPRTFVLSLVANGAASPLLTWTLREIGIDWRSLGALEGTLRLLSPDVDLVTVARSRGREAVATRITPEGLRGELTDQLATLIPLLQRLPRRLSGLVEDLHAGELTLTVRTMQDRGERRFLTDLVQQVVLALLAATTAISGVLLVLADQGPRLAGDLDLTTYLGLVVLLFAFVLGSRVLVLVFRTARGP